MFIEIRSEIIRRISDSTAELLCDVHHYLTYGDTRTVAFRPEIALRHLLPYQDELDENRGVIIEHLMAQCIHRTLLSGGKWAPLPCTPVCDGMSGSWDLPQVFSLRYLVKQSIKRRVASLDIPLLTVSNIRATMHSISLVVATKDRPGDLERLLESLRRQDAPPAEIVVVDASSEPAEPVVARFPELIIRYLKYWPPSASAQRNAGILACNPASTLIGFADDDTTFEPNAFARMLHFWNAAPT